MFPSTSFTVKGTFQSPLVLYGVSLRLGFASLEHVFGLADAGVMVGGVEVLAVVGEGGGQGFGGI